MPDEPTEPSIDWSLTTWDGARREQMRRARELPLVDIIRILEEMEQDAIRLAAARGEGG